MTTFNTTSRQFAMKTTMLSLGSTSGLAAILMLSIGMLGSAAAKADQVTGDSRSQQVKLSDLDLSTTEGQQLAQARMREVARTLCSRVADALDLSRHENYIKCVDAAVAKAGERLQARLNRQPASQLARADVK
jgi:UrcA family protein